MEDHLRRGLIRLPVVVVVVASAAMLAHSATLAGHSETSAWDPAAAYQPSADRDGGSMTERISPAKWRMWLDDLKEGAPVSSIARPFRVASEQDESITRDDGSEVPVRAYDLEVPYLDIEGRAAVGRAHLFMPADAAGPMPVVVNVHYEAKLAQMAQYVREGWAAVSAAQALPLFSDSINFNLALVQAVRASPFADAARIAVVGASAGGYVALMTASEAFPLAAASPQAPIVNACYNVAYSLVNGAADGSRAPVLHAITPMIAEAARPLGDTDHAAANWIADSPVGVCELITCPVQATFSTADMLVPINQVGAGLGYPLPAALPAGFTFEMEALVKDESARLTLLGVLRGERVKVFRRQVPTRLPRYWELDPKDPPKPSYCISPPFSDDAQFSVTLLDEGPPDPRLGHYKHFFRYSNLEFVKHWLGKPRPVPDTQLTAPKLAALMRRFLGENFEGLIIYDGGAARTMNRRNRLGKERLDVVLGLRAYCGTGDAYLERLAGLYAALPQGLRALDARRRGTHARFEDDIPGGLAFHEAMLHHKWGSDETAHDLAASLLRDRRHQAYAACLPDSLAGDAGR